MKGTVQIQRVTHRPERLASDGTKYEAYDEWSAFEVEADGHEFRKPLSIRVPDGMDPKAAVGKWVEVCLVDVKVFGKGFTVYEVDVLGKPRNPFSALAQVSLPELKGSK